MKIAPHLDQEEAWNYGASVSAYIPVFGKTLNVNAEYYYTDFLKQVVVDMDSNPHEVAFYNLDGRSYSHVFQVEASYPFFKGFNLDVYKRQVEVRIESGMPCGKSGNAFGRHLHFFGQKEVAAQ